MFKKLKDRIAEEVKSSPKLQASVQQLAQAMGSPSSSLSSMQESTSNDNFSIAEESEVSETPRNSPERDSSSFQRVDLRGDVLTSPPRCPAPRSRRSSASSMMSDVSSLFPVYESPNNAYHFQSDLESTSEFEEISGSTSHLQSISKEQLLIAYRKTQSRYHKYKGRYVDLARHFKELERQNGKIKAVLTETQDRALRKIAELKEQCALEQKAKAHLEDALRNDLEEKDHLIDTLKTKVKLLKYDDVIASKSIDWPKRNDVHEDVLVDIPERELSESVSEFSVQSDLSLQEKVTHLEAQLAQYQQSQKEYEEKLLVMSLDKAKLESAHELMTSENVILKKELETQRKREEEAALSLAENKMQVHRELEAREEEAKKLKTLVAKLQDEMRALTLKKSAASELTSSTMQTESALGGSAVIEDSGAGGDGVLPSFSASTELMQLKEVLRAKYKEIEVLAAENGRLRASLMMTKSHSDHSGPREEESEHDLIKIEMSESESMSSSRKGDLLDGLENWMADEVSVESLSSENFLQKHKTKEISDYGSPNFTSDLSGESSNFFSIQPYNKNEGKTTKISEIEGEMNADTKWESKYCEIKGELEKLLKEWEEIREVLALNVSPSESVACSDDGYRANENNVSLVDSLTSVLNEKRNWKEEAESLKARLNGLYKECRDWKERAEMLKTEKNHLGLDLKQARDELDRLRYNMDDLKELNVELQKSKEAGESSTASLSEISRECEDLKKELSRVHADSKIEMERARAEYSSEISLALSTLEEKQKELEKVKEQLQSAVSQAELSKIRSNDDLMARCIRAEEELCQEREKRLTAEQSMNSFQNGLCREFVGALSDGKRLLHEAVKSVTALEQEVDGLKAECDASNLREEDTKNAIVELKRACDEQKDVMQKIVEKAQLDLEEVMKERDEARRGLSEAQQMALKIEGEKEALAGKKQEAESRASKVENELKVVRELEERAKVEAEEAIHEQEAMRRSWEMQREQIESMSREIERLKKAEDGLIRVLKEVREEVKNKEMEVKRTVEESLKEKKAISHCEEKLKGDINSMKKSLEEISGREEQVKKELEKTNETCNEWKTKSEALEKDLAASMLEMKNLQEKLDAAEEDSLKSSEEIVTLTKDLSASTKKEREIKSELAKLMKEMDSVNALLATNKGEVESLVSENRKLNSNAKDLEDKIEMLKKDRNEQESRAEALANELNGLKCERNDSVSQLNVAKEEWEKMEKLVQKLKESQEKHTEEMEMINAYKRKLEKDLEEKDKEMSQLQIEMLEMAKMNGELKEKLEDTQSKILSEVIPEEEEVEFKRVNNVGSTPPAVNVTNAVEVLAAERDKAIMKASVVEQRMKSLEEELTSLNERAEVEKRALEEEIKKYSRELSLMREGHESWMDSGKMKEELEGLKHAKENLEKRLIEAERGESMVVDRQARIVELEEEIAELKSGYSMSIASREEEHEEELSSYSEKMKAEVEYIKRQLMEEIKGLREEIVLKGNELDYRVEEHNKLMNEKEAELSAIKKLKEEEKRNAEQFMKNETSKWANQVSEMETKNKEMLEALQKQWEAEKRDLEVTSKVAVAAVESGTGSMTYLKRQMQAQARELAETKRKYSSEILELRHLLSMQKRPSLIDPEKSNLDDSTELEYLRNILYEYMMGKEPVVLAKVIAAVVKFDDEQTKKILVKEEQKQTLLGQFGLT